MMPLAKSRGRCRKWWSHAIVPTAILVFLALMQSGPALADQKSDSSRFPSRLNIRLMRSLERQLSDIELALVDEAKLSKQRVRNVTMPLQNFIDDVVLASGRYTDIYPQAIYDVLIEEFSTAKPRTEIAELLVEYQKHGQFRARAEVKASKAPQKAKAGV